MRWPHSTHASLTVSTPPLTSTVKLSLFMQMHSSPLSLAARLHGCHANDSHYVNNGWTFSGQTLYIPSRMLFREYDIDSIFSPLRLGAFATVLTKKVPEVMLCDLQL